MSNSNFDHDAESLALGGVFGADQAALQPGLKRHQSVPHRILQGGVELKFDCQSCGMPILLVVEYPEIVALKYGVNPAVAFRFKKVMATEPTSFEFLPHQNGWLPKTHCHACNKPVEIVVEPHEPENYLKGARRRGFINAQGEHQISQLCAQVAQGGQSVRR